MSLTWKLILGFLFALALQVAQIAIGNTFTARLQEVAVLVADTLAANVAVHSGLEAVAQLRSHLPGGDHGDKLDCAVLRVYVDELGTQVAAVAAKAPEDAAAHVQRLCAALGTVVTQFAQVEPSLAQGRDSEAAVDALAFLDDAVQDLDQELHRMQIELRTVADQGVSRERSIRDLPLRASLAIAAIGVVILAMFVAWFSRQLVIPIQRAWAELEGRVADRTRELAHTVAELESQILHRREAEAQKDEMHRQLVDASRRAGMAELANGVLHNVGNVLNSVNVSASVLSQRLRDSRITGVGRAAALLQSHAAHLPEFLGSQQGPALLTYLQQLSAHLQRERDLLVDEAGNLSARIDHMKEIVDRQQGYARGAGVATTVSARAIAEEAVEMQRIPLQQAGIAVTVDGDGEDSCELDRARVLQILMNVVSNARHAIRDTGRGEGHIEIRTERTGELLRYRIRDDGVGIAPDHLERVFGHGFTTKRDGHGFGLHHSANAATEMGGRLWAESEGLGHGTTLVLELPIRRTTEVLA